MKQSEPDFWVLEYITITKDPRTGLVVALGGTQHAAGILQRAGGFLDAPGPRGDYHRLPQGLTAGQQRLQATAASHALLAAGYSVHLDPVLNAFTSPDGDREAALRYLAQLSERAHRAGSSAETAEVLTEIAGPDEGLLPLIRQVVVSAWTTWSQRLDAAAEYVEPAERLGEMSGALSDAADRILLARNHAASATDQPAPTTPPSPERSAPTRPSPARQPPPAASRRR
ncbi:hypothetical protein [Streptomyces leeuwenhoekii]|uniref:Uncharacterized protein n=1 Tax=Streptomyces leeuwenhoekii TaxID=1437453 RepID=A0A0F7VPX2_STRLW|nr:hypothetical protein [Streptomyces leeuwenhoekii]CQR61855.1 Hypothetical Protein SCAB [Streptomyces leeuwenhoekii]